MKLDLFIKTYPGDHQWLPYLLRSIRKYAIGYRWVTIVTENDFGAWDDLYRICLENDPGHHCNLREAASVSEFIPEGVELPQERTAWGYQYQKGIKLQWDKYTDADAVLQVDSDMMFRKAVDVEKAWFADDRPVWERLHWKRLPMRHLDSIAAWWPGIRWFSKRSDPAHFYPWYNMPGMGWLITREAVEGFQRYLLEEHGETPVEFFMNVEHPHMSVYNAFGIYLSEFSDGHGYEFWTPHYLEKELPGYLVANHSWSGMTEKAKNMIEEVLG